MDSFPGAIDHKTLSRTLRSGYAPNVKVFLQEIGKDGRGGPLMHRIDHWTSVQVRRELNGPGSASITLSNKNDRFFRHQFRRDASSFDEDSKTYWKDTLHKTLPYSRNINPDRFGGPKNFQGVRKLVTDDDVSNYLSFLYNFDGWNQGARVTAEEQRPHERVAVNLPSKNRPSPDLVDLGLMQRVVIDVKGQDGLWYAAFTGIVTGVEDDYRPGEMPMVTLQCSDYWRLLDLSEIYLQAGIDVAAVAASKDLIIQIKNQTTDFQSFSVSLASLTGTQILHAILDIVNQSMAFNPYYMNQQGLSGYFLGDEALSATATPATSLQRENYFQDFGFWFLPFFNKNSDYPATYFGETPLRRRTPQFINYGPAGILAKGDLARSARGIKNAPLNNQDDDEVSFPVAAINSTLQVDGNIENGPQALAYRFMIERILNPYESQKMPGGSIAKRVADASFYDLFFNANGDLVYQIPRFNNLPGQYAPDFERRPISTSTVVAFIQGGLQGADPTVPLTNTGDYGDFKAGDWDFAPARLSLVKGSKIQLAPPQDNFASMFHGHNYVITNVGLRRWKFSSREDLIVTDVEVPAQPNLVKEIEQIKQAISTGRAQFDDVKALQARFGHRYLQTQQMFIPNLYGGTESDTVKTVLDKYAFALLSQLNGKSSFGVLDMSSRPDLDVGNTILALERQRVYYVHGLTFSIQYEKDSADASTTLSLSFGHDIGVQIRNAFASVRDELKQYYASGGTTQRSAVVAGTSGANEGGGGGGQEAFGAALAELKIDSSGKLVVDGIDRVQAVAQQASGSKLTAGTTAAYAVTSKGTGVPGSARTVSYVTPAPSSLLAKAQSAAMAKIGRSISADEYTLARMIASEAGNGTVVSQVIRGFTVVAGIPAGSLTAVLTRSRFHQSPPNGFYGSQQSNPRASTAVDPTFKHLAVASAVLGTGAIKLTNPLVGGGTFMDLPAQRATRLKDISAFRSGDSSRFTKDSNGNPKPRTRNPTEIVARFYAGGLGLYFVEGIDPTKTMTFVSRSQKKVPTQPKDVAVKIASAYDVAFP